MESKKRTVIFINTSKSLSVLDSRNTVIHQFIEKYHLRNPMIIFESTVESTFQNDLDFQQLITLVRNGRIDLLVTDDGIFHRNHEDWFLLVSAVKESGASLMVLSDDAVPEIIIGRI